MAMKHAFVNPEGSRSKFDLRSGDFKLKWWPKNMDMQYKRFVLTGWYNWTIRIGLSRFSNGLQAKNAFDITWPERPRTKVTESNCTCATPFGLRYNPHDVWIIRQSFSLAVIKLSLIRSESPSWPGLDGGWTNPSKLWAGYPLEHLLFGNIFLDAYQNSCFFIFSASSKKGDRNLRGDKLLGWVVKLRGDTPGFSAFVCVTYLLMAS